MKRLHTWPVAGVAGAMVFVAVICVATGCAGARGEQKPASPEVKVAAGSASAAGEHRMLSGAELYAINCNRCHPERSAVERNAAEWQTILLHMRVRANLPTVQANAILDYLQANSGN